MVSPVAATPVNRGRVAPHGDEPQANGPRTRPLEDEITRGVMPREDLLERQRVIEIGENSRRPAEYRAALLR